MLGYEGILLLLGLASLVALIFVLVSRYVGPRNPNRIKQSTYECGLDPIGSARTRFSVKFYLVAMLFILFDIEVAFLYPWACLLRELGLFGLMEMAIFVFILLVGLMYAWRKGALDW